MMVYSYSEARERLSALLESALSDGQVKLKNREGQVFVIRPEKPLKKSPFEVRSVELPVTKGDILEAIRESRERY